LSLSVEMARFFILQTELLISQFLWSESILVARDICAIWNTTRSLKNWKKSLKGILRLKKTRVQAEVFHEDEKVKTISGLNEILIGGISRTVFLKIGAIGKNREFEAKIIGDGIIVSTQVGSTAYSINAGGTVLLTDVFSVVANNGLFESDFLLPNTKSFVTSVKAVFEVSISNPHKQNLPYLVADGQRSYRLKNGDFVVIKKSEKETLFIRI